MVVGGSSGYSIELEGLPGSAGRWVAAFLACIWAQKVQMVTNCAVGGKLENMKRKDWKADKCVSGKMRQMETGHWRQGSEAQIRNSLSSQKSFAEGSKVYCEPGRIRRDVELEIDGGAQGGREITLPNKSNFTYEPLLYCWYEVSTNNDIA